MVRIMENMATSFNAYKKELQAMLAGDPIFSMEDFEIDGDFIMDKDFLLRTFGPSQSDSANTQQKSNRLFFGEIIKAHEAAGVQPAQLAVLKKQLVQFFCFLCGPSRGV
jgi:hypothetical protein